MHSCVAIDSVRDTTKKNIKIYIYNTQSKYTQSYTVHQSLSG